VASFAQHIIGPDTHANRPAAGTVPAGTLYACTTDSKLEQSNGSAWSDYLTAGGGTITVQDEGGALSTAPRRSTSPEPVSRHPVQVPQRRSTSRAVVVAGRHRTGSMAGRRTPPTATTSPAPHSTRSGRAITRRRARRPIRPARRDLLSRSRTGRRTQPSTSTRRPLTGPMRRGRAASRGIRRTRRFRCSRS
jgi:hypothetical protein